MPDTAIIDSQRIGAETLAADGSGEIDGPFTDIVQQASIVIFDTVAGHVPRDLHWKSVLLTLFLAVGIVAYLFDGGITQATILNIGIFTLLFGFNGSFRHYHVSFRYPRWLEKWIQSPGMHHTHHSYLQKHWDANLAAVTSIWDRMFGTLYIPEPDEYTPYRTFRQNTTVPFRDWYKMMRGRESALSRPVSSDDLVSR